MKYSFQELPEDAAGAFLLEKVAVCRLQATSIRGVVEPAMYVPLSGKKKNFPWGGDL